MRSGRQPRIAPRFVPRSFLVLLALLASLTLVALGHTTSADAATANEACSGNSGVTVVVDATNAGGGIVVRCALGPQASGWAALEAAGFALSSPPRFPGTAVCQIDGLPASGYPDCWETNVWWYSHADSVRATWVGRQRRGRHGLAAAGREHRGLEVPRPLGSRQVSRRRAHRPRDADPDHARAPATRDHRDSERRHRGPGNRAERKRRGLPRGRSSVGRGGPVRRHERSWRGRRRHHDGARRHVLHECRAGREPGTHRARRRRRRRREHSRAATGREQPRDAGDNDGDGPPIATIVGVALIVALLGGAAFFAVRRRTGPQTT